jgi:hypothetical protein
MATRAATRKAAQAQSTRSGRVPQERIDELIRPGLGQKDVRLRSLAPTARKQEAIRRLNDPETAAGKPGTNLCRYAGDDKQMTGKRPGYYNKRNISANAVRLCKQIVDEAWTDPAFLKEEKIACGDDKKWVFAHQRGDKRVKGHCRKVDAPRPRAKKPKADPREKELAALIRKRDGTSNMSEYNALDKQIKALRAELKPKAQSKPKPKPSPSPPRVASKPFGVDTGDTFGVLDRLAGEDFTGDPGTGFDGVTKPVSVQPQPKFNQRIYTYVQSLPRGQQKKAMNALRQYVYGPGRMQPDDAIERYRERLVRDAQAPVGSTEFDELDASDSDAEDDPMSQFAALLRGNGVGEITNGAGDGSRDDTTVPMYDAMFPPAENEDDSPVPGAAIAHRAMVVGQNRERALANARVEAERAAAEARRARFVTVDLPRILARSPDQRDRILAVFANMIRDDEMANLMRDADMGGDGVSGGAHDAERLAVANAKATAGHVRRVLTRFDDENNTWLDPDRSGPANSAMNQLYDSAHDVVANAERALQVARDEHMAMGYNALDGSQLEEMLAGQGSALTITAY